MLECVINEISVTDLGEVRHHRIAGVVPSGLDDPSAGIDLGPQNSWNQGTLSRIHRTESHNVFFTLKREMRTASITALLRHRNELVIKMIRMILFAQMPHRDAYFSECDALPPL